MENEGGENGVGAVVPLCDALIAAALLETGYRGDDEPNADPDAAGAAADVAALLGSGVGGGGIRPSRAALSALSAR
jgi:hypothetical protein